MLRYFFILFFLTSNIYAQVKIEFLTKNDLNKPVQNITISLTDTESKKEFITKNNQQGKTNIYIPISDYQLKVTPTNYYPINEFISVKKDTLIELHLIQNHIDLQDIVITAKEKESTTSTSVIDSRAIKHLQPSSFTDLLSLLPGNSVKQPLLNQANHITIRETGINDKNYSIGSLGTSFVIDEIPINSNANMQEIVGGDMLINPNSGYVNSRRNSTRKGVDMRSISTDNIEKVEVIRGIPSVKYGDLSSGLVKIIRKKGFSKWNTRFKADGYSKLFYVGKGFDFNRDFTLNLDIDYLDAKADPRNDFENYKRYTISARGQKKFNTKNPIDWNFSLDYTGTVEEEKTNPDIEYNKHNSYISDYKNIRLSNTFKTFFDDFWLKHIELSTSISQSFDKLKQSKWVQLTNALGIPINKDAGEHYGIFIEPNYVSHLLIDGKPLDIYSDLSAEGEFNALFAKNTIIGGFNWSYSKNNGLGQVYDITHPPTPEMKTRPRAFKDIPAMQSVSFYLENNMLWNWKNTKLLLNAGIRGNSLLGLDKAYDLHNKIYLDPRVNFRIDFPNIFLSNKKHIDFNLTMGWGKNSKIPTQNMIYPQDIYWDFMQLNYYHNNKDYRQLHYQTFIVPQINYDIKPAINTKKEIRLGVKYDYHDLSLTYFSENMTSGFRQMTDYQSLSYKKYDTSHLDHSNITAAPLVENLPFTTEQILILSNKESNGSAINKKGIEFQYSSKRFNTINTRLTINGAWFKTYYSNSLPVYRFPKNLILNGKRVYNLGLYEDEDSYEREQFNSALTADTYIPVLDLTTSFRVDFNWYYIEKQRPQNGTPTHYIDKDGIKHPYGEKEKQDYALQFLNINYSPDLYIPQRTPFYL